MAEEKIHLGQFNLDTSGLIKATQETKAALEQLIASQKSLKKQGDTTSEQYIKTTAQVKTLRGQYNAQIKVIQQLTTAQTKELSVTQALTGILSGQVTSIAEARDQNKKLLALRNEINLTTEAGQKQLHTLNQQIDANNTFIKTNVSSLEAQKLSIGDYKTAIIEASKEVTLFGRYQQGLTKLFQIFSPVFQSLQRDFVEGITHIRNYAKGTEQLSAAQKVATITTNLLSGGLKLLKVALVSTGIGAVVVALGSLAAYLSTTQAGIDKLNRVLVPLKTVFESLVGLFQEVGEALFKAFSNPIETLEQLHDFVKDQLTQQFKAFGKILAGIFTLDFSLLKEGFDELATLAQERLGQVNHYFDRVGDTITEAYSRGQQLQSLQEQIERRENNLILLRSEQNRIIKEQNKIAEDINKTLQDRENAARASIEASERLLEEEQAILDLKIQQKQLDQESNDTSREDQAELNQLIAERNQAETRALELQTTQQNKLNTIRQQAQSEALKAVEARIQKQQEELGLFIARQGFQKQSAAQEIEIARQVAQRKKAILEEELTAKKISLEKYHTEILTIDHELAKQQAEATLENTARELAIFREGVEKLRDEEQFLTQLRLEELIERQTLLADQERAYHQQRFEQGLATEVEYLDAIKQVNIDHQAQLSALRQEREQAIQEEKALQLETERIALEERGATIFELESFQIEEQRERDIEAAREKYTDHAMLTQALLNIDAKAATAQAQVEAQLNQSKLSAKMQALQAVGQLFGQETALGKAAAIAQTTINTYSAATAALAPPPLGLGPVFGPPVAGLTIASGLANVAKIVGINLDGKQGSTSGGLSALAKALGNVAPLQPIVIDTAPPFADGGVVTRGIPIHRSNGDNRLITAKVGEVILNQQQQDAAGGAPFFKSLGVPGFASGGVVGGSNLAMVQNNLRSTVDPKLAELISRAVAQGAQEGTFLGSQSGIYDLATEREIAAGANF